MSKTIPPDYQGRCDFCADECPPDEVTCFIVERTLTIIPALDIVRADDGLWAACKECEPLVTAGLRDAVTDRAVEGARRNFEETDRIDPDLLRATVAFGQQAFWHGRAGVGEILN